MRNLKRALSLTLASVMLLGMMVVGSSALSFNDADDISNVTAASVLQELGVMVGDNNNNFLPDQPVTRAQMAIIICRIMYGNRLNVDTLATEGRFTDVAPGAYYTGYVNFAAEQGIISGYGDGRFGPDDTVTTAQAALMLARGLGYFKAGEDKGDWASVSLTAITQATKLGMFGDLRLGTNDLLARDNVAEMTFNTLTKANPVQYSERWDMYYTDSQSILNGVQFNYTKTLGFQNYDLVYKTSLDKDPYGRPCVCWGVGRYSNNQVDAKGDLYDGNVTLLNIDAVVVDPIEADLTYTKNVSEKDLATAVGANTLGYTWTGYNNGASMGAIALPNSTVTTDYGNTARGVLTQVYIDGVARTVKVVYTHNYLAQVTRTGSDADGRYVTVAMLNGTSVKDRTYHTNNFATDDYVIVTVAEDEKGDNYIASMALAETKEGTVTGYSDTTGGRYITLDSTKYETSGDMVADGIDHSGAVDFTTYRLYLDGTGYVVGYEQTGDAVTDYLYIVDDNVDGILGDFRARAVFPDGTTEVITIQNGKGVCVYNSSKLNLDDGGTDNSQPDDAQSVLKGKAFRYEKQSNGEYILKDGNEAGASYRITSATDKVVSGDSRIAGKVADLNTRFVHVQHSIRSYNNYVGYNNVPDVTSTTLYQVDHNKDGILDVVYIVEGSASNANSTIFYVSSMNNINWGAIKSGDTTFWSFDKAYVDGEKANIVVSETIKSTIQTGGVGAYKVLSTDSNGYVTALDATGTDAFNGDGYVAKGEMSALASGVGNNAIAMKDGTSWRFDDDTIFVYVNDDVVDFATAADNGAAFIKATDKFADDEATGVFVAKNDKNKAQLIFVVEEPSVLPGNATSAQINNALAASAANGGTPVRITNPTVANLPTAIPSGANLILSGDIGGYTPTSGALTLDNANVNDNTDLSGVNVTLSGETTIPSGKSLTLGSFSGTGSIDLPASDSKVSMTANNNLPKLTGKGVVAVGDGVTMTTPGTDPTREECVADLQAKLTVPQVVGVPSTSGGSKVVTFNIDASNLVSVSGNSGKIHSWSSTVDLAAMAARTGGSAGNEVVFVKLKLPANVLGATSATVQYKIGDSSPANYDPSGANGSWTLVEGEVAGTTEIIIPVTANVTQIILTQS